MQNFWDERYATTEYVYGTEPNEYFRSKLSSHPSGTILLPGEGEGRNAAFAASAGWNVTAFDTSEKGRKKALRIAKEKGVKIDYKIASYDRFNPGDKLYDAIGLFFTHTSPEPRNKFHLKLLRWLKPGGIIIMKAFHKNQITRDTGGPGNIDLLYSKEILTDDFNDLEIKELKDVVITLNEGPFHQGEAHVIRLYGKKPSS